MTSSGAAPIVLTVTAWRLCSGSSIASMVASTTGKYSGRHPAMTALMATFSTVTTLPRTGSVPSISLGDLPAASRNAPIFSVVGGTTGRPSVQPRSK